MEKENYQKHNTVVDVQGLTTNQVNTEKGAMSNAQV